MSQLFITELTTLQAFVWDVIAANYSPHDPAAPRQIKTQNKLSCGAQLQRNLGYMLVCKLALFPIETLVVQLFSRPALKYIHAKHLASSRNTDYISFYPKKIHDAIRIKGQF